jgi:hypothetical protein
MSSTEAERDSRTADRVLAWSLRICGGVDLLAIIAFAMPLEWIRQAHLWCGFGPFPEGPLPEYLARATSLLWGLHGALLLYLARDIPAHVRLIAFVARLTVGGGVLLLFLGLRTGLPVWWVALEGPVFAASGLWYLWWLNRR